MNKIFLTAILLAQVVTAQPETAIQYLYPLPGSDDHPCETQIIIRFKNITPNQIINLESFIELSTSSSAIDGKTIVSPDGKTILFKPSVIFTPGEKVRVHLHPVRSGSQIAFLDTGYVFTISSLTDIPQNLEKLFPDKEMRATNRPAAPNQMPVLRNGISFPSDFPWVNITINDNPDTGLIFLCTYISPYYSMILNNAGDPLWYAKTTDRRRDFKVQKNGQLTMLVKSGYGGGSHIAMDSTYTVIDTFFTPPGYGLDEHELQVLDNGNYLLIATDYRRIDLSDSVEGGNPNAQVLGNHVAEMDANDNPVLIWRCWDHLNITDAPHIDLTASSIDYVHMNAIEIDHDNNILISSRFLDEVTKIHRYSGDIIWRLGGKNNQFTWSNDDKQLAYQHDIRVLPNGNYTVFDNGNYRSPFQSRALELTLDTLQQVVTKVWEFYDDPPIGSKYMGNVQRLLNGNTLINWAVRDQPKLTEVRPDGSKAFEMDFINGYDCYRTFRFPWKGKAAVPYLVAESRNDRIILIFNKFGDADVKHYNIYGGVDPDTLQIIATTSQPYLYLFDLPNRQYFYFEVSATNSADEESNVSNRVRIYVNLTQSGQNMVYNGDFSSGFEPWQWQTHDSTLAQWEIDDSLMLHIQISEGGNDFADIQLLYPNLTLIEGYKYLFEFDAYAAENRIIEAEIKKIGESLTNYSRIGYTLVTTNKIHFSHEFTMSQPSDFTAGVVINAGNSQHDLFIDNVSLKVIVTDIANVKQIIPYKFSLQPAYPNPFNPTTRISFTLPTQVNVTLEVYNTLGQKIETIFDTQMDAGFHDVEFDASELPSGIYFYRMNAGEYSQVRKMVLVK